ncbi:hypothetical protein U1Q18_038054 [Sarracenia purpurea var. burkii]
MHWLARPTRGMRWLHRPACDFSLIVPKDKEDSEEAPGSPSHQAAQVVHKKAANEGNALAPPTDGGSGQ